MDDPRAAVRDADRLASEVMCARGYPTVSARDWEAAVGADHPHVVSHYRAAHAIVMRCGEGRASTEDMRLAFVHYRSLFDEMLERYLVGGKS